MISHFTNCSPCSSTVFLLVHVPSQSTCGLLSGCARPLSLPPIPTVALPAAESTQGAPFYLELPFRGDKTQTNSDRKEKEEKKGRKKKKDVCLSLQSRGCWKSAGEAAGRPLAASPGQLGDTGTSPTEWAQSRQGAGCSRGGGVTLGAPRPCHQRGPRGGLAAAWAQRLGTASGTRRIPAARVSQAL